MKNVFVGGKVAKIIWNPDIYLIQSPGILPSVYNHNGAVIGFRSF